MSSWLPYAVSAVGMIAGGLVGAFETDHPVRRVMALNIASSGVFLLLVASARRSGAAMPDPVPHALVLTGIVVSVSATALGLSLAKRAAAGDDEPRR